MRKIIDEIKVDYFSMIKSGCHFIKTFRNFHNGRVTVENTAGFQPRLIIAGS